MTDQDDVQALIERLKALGDTRTEVEDLSLAALERLQAEVAKLAAFKAFVHRRLDDGGVPVDPPGEHASRGCRVGQRLKWLFDQRDAAEAEAKRLREALRKHGKHDRLCAVVGGYDYPCNCGLAAALAATQPPASVSNPQNHLGSHHGRERVQSGNAQGAAGAPWHLAVATGDRKGQAIPGSSPGPIAPVGARVAAGVSAADRDRDAAPVAVAATQPPAERPAQEGGV